MIQLRATRSAVIVLALAAWPVWAKHTPDRQGSQQQTPPPPPIPAPTPPTTATPGSAAPGSAAPSAGPAAPVLPVDARRLVDEVTQQLIQQLKGLQDAYLANKRPDDAAAVRTQIRLLQRAAGLAEDAPSSTSDIVNLVTYRDRVGQAFVFTITGSADYVVWGTGTYTDDTRLEAAAVHAGVLRSGQTGSVRVTVLAGQSRYEGSKRNGIESGTFGTFAGSYRIEAGPAGTTRPTSIANFRGRFGEALTVPVVGVATGSVWGSDIYTDDSSLAAAAVHAGLLRPGEFGFVRVTMLGGQASYPSVSRNGVTSQAYGEWQGSIKVERAPQPWILRLPDDVDASGMVSLPALRSQIGVSFSLQVIGAAGGVRGSDIYTDDSSIAAAAVHAGVLKAGERGYVRVTILPGQQSYTGAAQNGVKSVDAGPWAGSFRLDRGSGGSQDARPRSDMSIDNMSSSDISCRPEALWPAIIRETSVIPARHDPSAI